MERTVELQTEAATSQHGSERKVLHIYRVENGFIPRTL